MSIWAELGLVFVAAGMAGCGSEPAPQHAPAVVATPVVDAAPPPPPPPPPFVDAGPPVDAAMPQDPRVNNAHSKPAVRVDNIGMHVGGGPFDEPTKEPFKKAVGPHHPEMASCWAKHITKQKPFDMGVDLLIEGAGGHPKVTNPRVHFEKGEDDGSFIPCIVAVFESVDFPKLDRGKSGVSYSLRFTPTP